MAPAERLFYLKVANLANTFLSVASSTAGAGTVASRISVAGASAWVGGAVGAGMGAAAGPLLAALLGLNAIASAQAEGRNKARRNAFKTGFARTMTAAARGSNWHPRNPIYRADEQRGKNLAVRIIRSIRPNLRSAFLERWGPAHGGFNQAIRDLGGFEV